MEQVVSAKRGGSQYPPIPEIRFEGGGHNLKEIHVCLGAHYPETLEQAGREVRAAMPKSVIGLVGRVEGNIHRRGFFDRVALQSTTENQITEAVSETHDFLNGKIDTLQPVPKADLNDLGGYWNRVLEEAQVTEDGSDRLLAMASAVLDTWRDIKVFTAIPKAQRIFEQKLRENQQGLPLPKSPETK
ncbi:MAG: hypothetical protein V1875_01055 [Candidatus Altiarchaeota archaeon]